VKTEKMWIVLSPYGYVLWDAMNQYKSFTREAAAKSQGCPWSELEADGWTLVKATVTWKEKP
jgi:hypothetical protein